MEKRSLVLFYSWSGNTRRVARIIAQLSGADLAELQPATAYPTDYAATVRRARQEIEKCARPSLRPLNVDWAEYDTVFLGTPNWCGTAAPPMYAFLYQVMPVEKYIIPFCTHGGGGAGRIAHVIAQYCIGCDVLPLLALRDDGGANAEKEIAQWLRRIHLIQQTMNEIR